MTEEKKSYADRRRFPRATVDMDVEYRPYEASEQVKMRKEKLISLGEGGCFLRSKLTYPKGTRLALRFSVDGVEVFVFGKIVHAVPFSPKGGKIQFPGMGICFEELGETRAAQIRKFVARAQLKQNLGLNGSS